MNFSKSRLLHLVGAAMIASSAFAVSPASAQSSKACVAGQGVNCDDVFARDAAPTGNRRYDEYVEYKEQQQRGLTRALARASAQGREAILARCQSVSPSQPSVVCP